MKEIKRQLEVTELLKKDPQTGEEKHYEVAGTVDLQKYLRQGYAVVGIKTVVCTMPVQDFYEMSQRTVTEPNA